MTMTSRLMKTPVMLAHQARRTMAAQASKAKAPSKLPPAKTNLPEAKVSQLINFQVSLNVIFMTYWFGVLLLSYVLIFCTVFGAPRLPLSCFRLCTVCTIVYLPRYVSSSTRDTSNTCDNLQMTVSSSGARVVSVETPNTPLSTLGVVVMGGSRHEDHSNQGATHALRVMAGASTRRFTQVQVVRSFQQAGAPIQCAQGREHLMYAVQMSGKDAVDQVIDFLLESVSNQAFNEWEVKDAAQRLNFELSEMAPTAKVNELLHRAAFRTGLGNSMFVQEHNVSSQV